MKQVKGITLVELLVVVVIIAIISAIAYPAYQSQVQKARRSEARAALTTLALAQERYYTVNGVYADDYTDLSLINSSFTANYTSNVIVTESGYYNVTLTANNTAFDVNAVASGAQSDDADCSYMKIDHLGVKTATNNTLCW